MIEIKGLIDLIEIKGFIGLIYFSIFKCSNVSVHSFYATGREIFWCTMSKKQFYVSSFAAVRSDNAEDIRECKINDPFAAE